MWLYFALRDSMEIGAIRFLIKKIKPEIRS